MKCCLQHQTELTLSPPINLKFPLTSTEILRHAVWRTWLFIAYSDENDYTVLPILTAHLYVFEYCKLWKAKFFPLRGVIFLVRLHGPLWQPISVSWPLFLNNSSLFSNHGKASQSRLTSKINNCIVNYPPSFFSESLRSLEVLPSHQGLQDAQVHWFVDKLRVIPVVVNTEWFQELLRLWNG